LQAFSNAVTRIGCGVLFFVCVVWQFGFFFCFIGKGSALASIGIVATLDKSRATMPSKRADKIGVNINQIAKRINSTKPDI